MNDLSKDNLGRLDCGHEFCFTCIYNWLQTNKKCPICRSENINLVKIIDSKFSIKNFNLENSETFRDNYGTKVVKIINIIKKIKQSKIVIISQFINTINVISSTLEKLEIILSIINTKKNTKSNIAIMNINDLFSIEKYPDVDQVYFMEPLFLKNNQIKYYLDYIYYLFNEPNKLKNLEFNFLIMNNTLEELQINNY